jgi:hypothetical protein
MRDAGDPRRDHRSQLSQRRRRQRRADGRSVRPINKSIQLAVWRALGTRDGGEVSQAD